MSLPLPEKEGEALLWMLVEISDEAESHANVGAATSSVLGRGWDRVIVSETCDQMQDMACGDTLPTELSSIERDILKACVEHSTWITQYRTADATRCSHTLISEAIEALRSLGDKLVMLGIPITHIPSK